MRLQSTLLLAAVLSNSTTAFAPLSPFALAPRPASLTSSARLGLPQVLPGVDLPPEVVVDLTAIGGPKLSTTPPVIPYPLVDDRVASFLLPAIGGTTLSMQGQSKSNKDATLIGQNQLVDSQGLAKQIPDAKEYKFFGNGKHSKNLEYLLKTNPFMAAALTERDDGFELRSFDKHDPEAEDDSATLFRQLMSCLGGGAGHRVNIRFNSDMAIVEIRVYEENKGKRIQKIKSADTKPGDDDVEKWASSALFNLGFYASCVHADIHVLHYLLTAGLDFSSQGFGAMNEWAKFYATNIPAKYKQVSDLLIRSQPPVTDLLTAGNDATVKDTYALLTGSSGFGANGDKLRPILTNLLNEWCTNPSKYFDTMMNIPKEKMKKAGILTEFMKHHDLVHDYAHDVRKALKKTDRRKFETAEKKLKDYLNNCQGFESEIDSLKDWIEIMADTGIVHGCTLSYSRLFADTDILRWRDIQCSTWQSPDINLHLKILATASGMVEHRHVMSTSTLPNDAKYDSKLQEVLKKYEGRANGYKEAYKCQIMENTEEFNNFGWILSDFCPDGFDGKQLTVTTYI